MPGPTWYLFECQMISIGGARTSLRPMRWSQNKIK